MTVPERTADLIAEGVARAERVACSPANDGCSALPDPVPEARKSCTPKGRCTIDWILADAGRETWDVWLDVQTGEGRLRRRDERRHEAASAW